MSGEGRQNETIQTEMLQGKLPLGIAARQAEEIPRWLACSACSVLDMSPCLLVRQGLTD